MDAQNSSRTQYVFSIDAVKRAISELTRNPTHEHVPGYLAVMRAQAARSGLSARSSDITDVYDRYFRVSGAKDRFPYLRVFMSRGKGLKLSNKNVAGSYAISNRRSGGPFFQVVSTEGDRRETRYTLNSEHGALAMTHLLQGNKLPITALAVFFYRDYGLELEERRISSVVETFRKEFGLDDSVSEAAGNADSKPSLYQTICYDDSGAFSDDDLVQVKGSAQ